jgi:hypothetical protein
MVDLCNIGVVDECVQDLIISNFALAEVNRIRRYVMVGSFEHVLLALHPRWNWSSQTGQDGQMNQHQWCSERRAATHGSQRVDESEPGLLGLRMRSRGAAT